MYNKTSIKLTIFLALVCSYLTIVAQNHDAELIYSETSIIFNRNELEKSYFFELKINNRSGEKYSKISIPHSKLSKIHKLNAYIKDSNGLIVRKLNKNEIVDRSYISDFSFYEDHFVSEFSLKHNQYPYSIVYSYIIQQKEFLYIEHWAPLVDMNIPTVKSKLTLTVPVDYAVSYENNGILPTKIESLLKTTSYSWETGFVDVIPKEIFSPQLISLLPSVEIVPKNFHFEIDGSFSDWTSYGNWQFSLNKELGILPQKEINTIRVLTKNSNNDFEKIKTLYHYLQDETRYVNISIETGGLKPYPSSYVAHNKYGDCKALTNYFKSVLDTLGIQSYYSKIYAGSPNKEIKKSFPAQQFNHVILYIPSINNGIWIDCTSKYAFNYLGTFTQNRDALIIDENNSHFCKTPALQFIDVIETRKIEIYYDSINAKIKSHNIYKGDKYESIMSIKQGFNDLQKQNIISKFFLAEGCKLIDYSILNEHRDSAYIELFYQATKVNLYKHYGDDILIENVAFDLPIFEKPNNRKLPVQIDYPIYKIDTIYYEVPTGYHLYDSTYEVAISNTFGSYSFKGNQIDNKIVITKSLLVNAGFYPVINYNDLYLFFRQITDSESTTLVLTSKSQNNE